MTSLVKVLQQLESTPDLMNYGMLGLQQYSADASTPVAQGSFSHCPLHSSIMMNLDKLQEIKYNPNRYWWEDVDLSLQVLADGIPTCRFNHLVVAKKFIEMGGNTAFKEEPAVSTDGSSHNKELLPGDKLVTAPDREDAPYLPVPAYYLLERYLELMGAARLFPEAVDNSDHPVLVVDCYVNLGPRICLEFVSSRSWDKSKKNEKQDTRYGCIFRQLCDSFLFKYNDIYDEAFCVFAPPISFLQPCYGPILSVCTLIDDKSEPISAREIGQLLYKKTLQMNSNNKLTNELVY